MFLGVVVLHSYCRQFVPAILWITAMCHATRCVILLILFQYLLQSVLNIFNRGIPVQDTLEVLYSKGSYIFYCTIAAAFVNKLCATVFDAVRFPGSLAQCFCLGQPMRHEHFTLRFILKKEILKALHLSMVCVFVLQSSEYL